MEFKGLRPWGSWEAIIADPNPILIAFGIRVATLMHSHYIADQGCDPKPVLTYFCYSGNPILHNVTLFKYFDLGTVHTGQVHEITRSTDFPSKRARSARCFSKPRGAPPRRRRRREAPPAAAPAREALRAGEQAKHVSLETRNRQTGATEQETDRIRGGVAQSHL